MKDPWGECGPRFDMEGFLGNSVEISPCTLKFLRFPNFNFPRYDFHLDSNSVSESQLIAADLIIGTLLISPAVEPRLIAVSIFISFALSLKC